MLRDSDARFRYFGGYALFYFGFAVSFFVAGMAYKGDGLIDLLHPGWVTAIGSALVSCLFSISPTYDLEASSWCSSNGLKVLVALASNLLRVLVWGFFAAYFVIGGAAPVAVRVISILYVGLAAPSLELFRKIAAFKTSDGDSQPLT